MGLMTVSVTASVITAVAANGAKSSGIMLILQRIQVLRLWRFLATIETAQGRAARGGHIYQLGSQNLMKPDITSPQ